MAMPRMPDRDRWPHPADQIAGKAARECTDQAADLEEYRHNDGSGGRVKVIFIDDIGRDVEGHRVERISQRDKDQKTDEYATAKGRIARCFDDADATAIGAAKLGKYGAEALAILRDGFAWRG